MAQINVLVTFLNCKRVVRVWEEGGERGKGVLCSRNKIRIFASKEILGFSLRLHCTTTHVSEMLLRSNDVLYSIWVQRTPLHGVRLTLVLIRFVGPVNKLYMVVHFNQKTRTNSVTFCGIKYAHSEGENVTCLEIKNKIETKHQTCIKPRYFLKLNKKLRFFVLIAGFT